MTQQTILEEGAFQRTQRDQINENFTELYAAVGQGTGNITTENLTVEGTAQVDGAMQANGGAVFNEGSADVDFRVESNGNANAIFVDAGNDRVGIFTASPTVPLDVTGAILGSTTITAGTSVIAGTYVRSSVGNALTATGTDRATALQLAAQVNNVTTTAASTGVVLPVGAVGMEITIANNGAETLQVYASASETINGTAGATGITLATTKFAKYWFTAANTWISVTIN
jgi:hypothetical protein